MEGEGVFERVREGYFFSLFSTHIRASLEGFGGWDKGLISLDCFSRMNGDDLIQKYQDLLRLEAFLTRAPSDLLPREPFVGPRQFRSVGGFSYPNL